MKRVLLILFAAAVLAGGMSETTAGPPTTLGWAAVVPAQAPVAEPTAVPPKVESVTPTPAVKPLLLTKAGKLVRWQDRRQRRNLGLSLREIRAKLQELDEAGELDDLRDKNGRITRAAAREHVPRLAAAVLDLAVAENPAAFAEYVKAEVSAGRDWSGFFAALMAFLEAFLPFILKFM